MASQIDEFDIDRLRKIAKAASQFRPCVFFDGHDLTDCCEGIVRYQDGKSPIEDGRVFSHVDHDKKCSWHALQVLLEQEETEESFCWSVHNDKVRKNRPHHAFDEFDIDRLRKIAKAASRLKPAVSLDSSDSDDHYGRVPYDIADCCGGVFDYWDGPFFRVKHKNGCSWHALQVLLEQEEMPDSFNWGEEQEDTLMMSNWNLRDIARLLRIAKLASGLRTTAYTDVHGRESLLCCGGAVLRKDGKMSFAHNDGCAWHALRILLRQGETDESFDFLGDEEHHQCLKST